MLEAELDSATAFNDLRTALLNGCGTELWVSAGTYIPQSGVGSEKLRVDEVRFGTSYGAIAPKGGAASPPLPLSAGQDYYFDLLHKAGFGSDRLSLRWTGPGVTNEIVSVPYLRPLTIPADLTTYDGWRRHYFPGVLALEALSGPDGDFFGDGVPNIVKYGFGLDPTAPDHNLLSHGSISAGFLNLFYRRVTSLTDVQYRVRVNDQLDTGSWTTNGISETILATNGTVQDVKASVPTNGQAHRYLHLQLIQTP